MDNQASRWIRFLRQYGPVPQNENMYDELIRRSAARAGVNPLRFEHPASKEVRESIIGPTPVSVVLTGTAGDGKTHLCRQVWEAVGGDPGDWQSPEPYLRTVLGNGGTSADSDARPRVLHIVRDLSAWVPQRGAAWEPAKEELLRSFSASLFSGESSDVFLIAGNDGQLIETWRRLARSDAVERTQVALEMLLVEDRRQAEGIALRFFNLSRHSSADLFTRALDAFVSHPGWDTCRALNAGAGEFFGPECSIRRNLELLETSLVRQRLQDLLALCDNSRLHIPIRQILMLLSNAVLGHPNVKNRLMTAEDVPNIIQDGTASNASLYSNIFGGNLTDNRRESTLVFEALGRFGIGHETSNRVDNILIYGETDSALRPYFDRLMANDPLYGADPSFRAAQRNYVEGRDEDEPRSTVFMTTLANKRQGMFFKIPDEEVEDLKLWELTVFRYAGEYLNRVVGALEASRRVDRPVLSRLVRGLNRVFTGMLLANDRDLLLATSVASSHGRVSRLLEERVSVEPHLGERVDLVHVEGAPTLQVTLDATRSCSFPLHLTRYEFLSRVAEGALPSSFSKECYEDILAFKSQLLAALSERRQESGEERPTLALQLLEVDETGKAAVFDFEMLSSGS